MKKIFFTILAFGILSSSSMASSDPLFLKQWGLENTGQTVLRNISDLERVSIKGIPGVDINWIDTQEIASDKKELIVAVIDSGVDIEHPDLKGRIWYNEKICAGAPNAKNLACNGYNYLENNVILTDDIGHGTHVAGIIAANRNNIGVAGAADLRVKIMPLKVLNSEVKGFVYNGKIITDVIAEAMNFAMKNGAEVINLSLGWPKLINTAKIKKAFQDAEDNNIIVVAAAGNNNKDLPTFPCAYENVICVGAIDNRGQPTSFTNHGSKVDVVAPGEFIVSTYPRNLESRTLRIKNYETKNGSSQAAPYVAAAIANLKLLHPGLSNDQVRKLLFSTSKKLNLLSEHRFVKFGQLDMKALLEAASNTSEDTFISPQLKSITEVRYKRSDRKFSFDLELKNLTINAYKGLVCFKVFSTSVQLKDNCLNIETSINQKSITLPVSGLLVNLSSDSHVLLQVQIDQHVYQTSLVFTRDLSEDSELLTYSLGKESFDEMGVLRGETKISRLTRVVDKFNTIKYPEYFYLEKAKQSETQTVISLVTNEAQKFLVKNIVLTKVTQVLSIHRQDINQDGQLDYFIYTLNKKNLEFHIYDNQLNPLFKNNSTWVFPISTFEGLPVEASTEKFEWIKVKNSKLGDILVPSLFKSYEMPEADNSKTISERVIGNMPHQFYLNPVVNVSGVSVELRVVDTIKMMNALRKKLGVIGSFDEKTVYLLKPFPQTEEESRSGKLRSLIALDDGGLGTFYEVSLFLDGNNFSDLKFLSTEKAIDQSVIYPVIDSATGDITKEAVFTSLLNRSSAEFMTNFDARDQEILKLVNDWENPIINLKATSIKNSEKTFLIEGRSTVTLLRGNGENTTLPVYRDSSFPGQSFSETLMPILSNGRPGIYINSTLIYGERLYSMIDTENNGFIRPLRLSINIPGGCVPLSPESFGDKTNSNYVFLCVDSSKDVSLKFLPISMF